MYYRWSIWRSGCDIRIVVKGGANGRKIWSNIVYKSKRRFKKYYILYKNNLKEPDIANKYAKMLKDEIKTLSYFPQRNAIIDNNIIKELKSRKIVIKNYIVFYRINEENNIVNIERILYGASNWINEL